MWERLFGVQRGGLWASVQALEIAVAIVVIGLIVAKITDRGDTPTQGKGKRK